MLVAEYDDKTRLAAEFTENELSDENTCDDTVDCDLRCPECKEPVTHRDRSTDGRVPHFSHCPDVDKTGCGESDVHKTLVKEGIAASEVKDELPGLDVVHTDADMRALSARCSGKEHRRPDVLMEFGERDSQFGEGLIIEVQWKNKQKDIPAVTADYLNGDGEYAVLWLDGQDDFDMKPANKENWSLTLTGSEIRKRVTDTIWPPANPTSVWAIDRSRVPSVTDDRLPKDLKELTESSGVLNQTERSPYQSDSYIWDAAAKIGDDATTVTARFTSDMVDEIAQRVKRSYDWKALFRPPSTDEYINDVKDSVTSNTVIPVTVPPQAAHEAIKSKEKPDHLEYVQNEDVVYMWHHLFIYGWRQSTDRTPYENLKDAVSIDSPSEFSRETIKSFAFAFIRGLGPKVAERGLNRMDDEGHELPMMEAADD